jgi:AcrR family transcriptional regulator
MAGTYRGIATEISNRIAHGDLRPGDRVPSTRQIAAEWGVAIATATKALADLQRRGLVRPIPGVGTVVAEDRATPADAAPDGINVLARRARPVPLLPTPTSTADGRSGSAAGRVPDYAAPRGDGGMRDRIVATAIRLADDEGIGAVSMRRIAAALGVPTMSLYRWVPSKDELTLYMIDATIGAMDWPSPPPPGWRTQLEVAARGQWAIMRSHPWVGQLVSMTRPQLAPNAMMHTEWVMRALTGQGLSGGEALQVSLTIVGFGIGLALALDNELQAERDTGMTSDDWMASQAARARAIFATGRFPMIASLAEDDDVDAQPDRTFDIGLGIILDGIERLIETRGATKPRAVRSRRTTGAPINPPRTGTASA